MRIIKNSAKCVSCGVEIESKHRHDFVVHICGKGKPSIIGDWRFAVDGGKDYIRRLGVGFIDTSKYEKD